MSASQTQVLKDTADALIIKLTRQQTDTTQESAVEKVNVATLTCLTFNLPTTGNNALVNQNGFQAGEVVRGNTSNATAVVVRWHPEANTLTVVNVAGNTFASGEKVTGTLTNSAVVLANTAVAPARVLDLESVSYSISDGGQVTLLWEGANTANLAQAATAVCGTLFGNGYMGKNALAFLNNTPASNSSYTANGSLAVTTAGLVANGGYSIVLELRKTTGFSPIPDERS